MVRTLIHTVVLTYLANCQYRHRQWRIITRAQSGNHPGLRKNHVFENVRACDHLRLRKFWSTKEVETRCHFICDCLKKDLVYENLNYPGVMHTGQILIIVYYYYCFVIL